MKKIALLVLSALVGTQMSAQLKVDATSRTSIRTLSTAPALQVAAGDSSIVGLMAGYADVDLLYGLKERRCIMLHSISNLGLK